MVVEENKLYYQINMIKEKLNQHVEMRYLKCFKFEIMIKFPSR